MIIAIANQKGGVGKTTLTYHLGYALAALNKKVLLLDFDPQASLTISLGQEPDSFDVNISDIMTNAEPDINKAIYKLSDNISYIPAALDLAQAETLLLTKISKELTLARHISKIKFPFDYILIDCPPQLSQLTINGLSCSDKVIIPVKTDYLSYRGLNQLETTINELIEVVNPKLQIGGVIANLYEMVVKDDNDILNHLTKKYNVLGIVKKRADLRKGIYDGITIIEKNPTHESSQELMKIAEKIIEW